MSKKDDVRSIEYYSDGQLMKIDTTPQIARAIGKYKDVYNKIHYFELTKHTLMSKRAGFTREIFVARSHRLKIISIKEYLPGVPEILSGAVYECGIINTKTQNVEIVHDGIPMLYHKLFQEHVK